MLLAAEGDSADVWGAAPDRRRGAGSTAGSISVAPVRRSTREVTVAEILGPSTGHRLETLPTGHRMVHPGIPTARRNVRMNSTCDWSLLNGCSPSDRR